MNPARLFPMLAALLCCSVLPASAAAATKTKTQATLRTLVGGLSGSSSVMIRETGTTSTLASRNASVKRVPASVNKLLTTSAVLLEDGPDARLATELRMRGSVEDGVLRGDLILRGGGDPGLRTDQLAQLADAVKKSGITRVRGRLHADRAGWTSQQGTAKTGGRYDPEIGGRLGPLVVLRGYGSSAVTDPARQTVVRLRELLRARGVTVSVGNPAPTGPGTVVLRTVRSATVRRLIASTNGPSDNFYAEMLLRGLGARHGNAGTTGAGTAVARGTLRRELGVSASMADGSGLSRGNQVSAGQVVRLLDRIALRDEGSVLRSSLPMAANSGTLRGRMRGTKAAGRCRAKTGTLRDVSALAGWCTTVGGRSVSFAILQNRVNVAAARRQQDRIAGAIAAWSDPAPSDPEEDAPARTAPATDDRAATPAPRYVR